MKKFWSVALCAAMLMGIATGCGQPADQKSEPVAPAKSSEAAEPAAPAAAKKYKIAFSVKTLTNEPFQAFISEGIKQKVEGLGHEFTLMTTSTSADVAQQVNQLEDLINSGIDGIILNPIDSNSVIPALEKAKEKGIQVILVDTPPVENCEDLYITYIGTDNYAASEVSGKKMAEDLGGKGKVVIVRGANGNTTGNFRADGFKKGLEGSEVQVGAEQPGNWTNDEAMQAMENMLSAHPDIDGVWSCSDVMLDGILQALGNNSSVKQDLKIYSFDGAMKGCQLIADGKVNGTMAQYPVIMGELAVDYLIEVLDGKKSPDDFEKFIDSGTGVITQENAKEAMKTAF